MSETQHKRFIMTESAGGFNLKETIQKLLGILPTDGGQPLTAEDYEAIYKEPPSFTQFLPFKDFDKEQQVFIMDDGLSVGTVFELTPIDVEGRSQKILEIIESGIQQALQRLPGDRDFPIIVQTYLNDEPITDLVEKLKAYATDEAKATKHHELWMREIEEHIQHLAKEDGLFRDSVAQFNWNGQYRKVRCVIYRKSNKSDYLTKSGLPIPGRGTPAVDLNDAVESFISALRQIGIESRRYEPSDLYNWLLPWFSPNPDSFDSPQEYLKARPFPDDDSCIGIGADLSEMLFTGYPESDKENGIWKFHGMPHRLISLQAIDNPPTTGILTAEIQTHAGSTASMWDLLPKGSTFVTTIVITSQSVVERHCNHIIEAAGQGSPAAKQAAKQANLALDNMASGHGLYPTFSGVYIRGKTEIDLARKARQAVTILSASKFNPIEPKYDPTALDNYLRHLPMAFDYQLDQRQGKSTRLTYTNHLACYLPLYGRGRGTGNPGNLFFNRIGEPMLFDPVKDKTRVAHGLIFGPTGAGKSALINYLVLHDMAMLKQRLFIIEKGNSFGLTGKYLASTGLTTNMVTFGTTSDISLPPYAKAFEALKQAEVNEEAMEVALSASVDIKFDKKGGLDEDDDEQEERDFLGEMELLTRLMITGADPKKEDDIEQPDKLLIRRAILDATREARDENKDYVIISDVVRQFKNYSTNEDLTQRRKDKIVHLAESLEYWTQGLHGRFFNRPGKQWPEVDVTILDMGILTSEQYQDMLAVTIISLINTITDIGEKYQNTGRQTHVYTDEGHVITTNPTLVKPFVFGAKTWRKLNIWLRQGTQQLKDYPKEAEKMLDLSEWWYLINTTENEVTELERFKSLTEDEKHLMCSTRKESKKYTEGVILSPNLKSIFRVVMPALPLVLAGTDGDEKKARREIMDEKNISELEACFYIADQIKKKRAGS
jgi:conjugative transfer ATPase